MITGELIQTSLQEPDYLDLNRANGRLDQKGRQSPSMLMDDTKSEMNIPVSGKAIDIVRPASTDGTPHPLPPSLIPFTPPCPWTKMCSVKLTKGFEPHSLPSQSTHGPLPRDRRPQSGDWTPLPAAMETLSLDDLKEPSSSSSNGVGSRRHTVSLDKTSTDNPFTKVPARTQTAIERVTQVVSKMGGQIQTHVQDNGGKTIHPSPPLTQHLHNSLPAPLPETRLIHACFTCCANDRCHARRAWLQIHRRRQ